MKFRRAVLTLLLAGLAGCGLFASRDAAPPGAAELIVYRPGRLVAVTNRYTLEVDGAAVTELANGSFLRLQLAPGEHAIGIADRELLWRGSLSAGSRHYLQLSVAGRAPQFELAFSEVSAGQAEAELEGLQEIELGDE